MESWVTVFMAFVKWKQWFQTRAYPIMKQPVAGLAELLSLHSRHQNIRKHNQVQLVEWFLVIWEEEKRGRENTYIWNAIIFKVGHGALSGQTVDKGKENNSWYSVTSLHQEGSFPITAQSFQAGQKGVSFRNWDISYSPWLPTSRKSTKYANHSLPPSSLPAENSPTVQLETTPGATHFSQHQGHGCPFLAVQKVWQTCSDSTVHKGGFEEEEVRCTFFPFHYDFFRIIFYSNASFPLSLFLEGTVYYICLDLNIR